MRIVSGKYRGRTINPPKNLKARPTTDFAKENLFNVIASRFDIEQLDVLDLFSGTGSIAFEFASRGAREVVSVEANNVHHAFIRSVAKELGMTQLHAIKTNAFVYIKTCKTPFDIIFADPPYDLPGIETIPDTVFARSLLKNDGRLVLEHSKDKNFSTHPRFLEKRTYGSVNFSVFGCAGDSI